MLAGRAQTKLALPMLFQAPSALVGSRGESKGDMMLFTLAVLLLIAWMLGIVGTYTIGAFVHVLLVVAIVLFLVGLISGRRTVV